MISSAYSSFNKSNINKYVKLPDGLSINAGKTLSHPLIGLRIISKTSNEYHDYFLVATSSPKVHDLSSYQNEFVEMETTIKLISNINMSGQAKDQHVATICWVLKPGDDIYFTSFFKGLDYLQDNQVIVLKTFDTLLKNERIFDFSLFKKIDSLFLNKNLCSSYFNFAIKNKEVVNVDLAIKNFTENGFHALGSYYNKKR